MNALYSNEVRQAVNIGKAHHWRFRPMSKKGTIEKPVSRKGWWYYPANKNTVIPQNAKKRIEVLEKSGLAIRQVIIGHEASKLLGAPPKPEPLLLQKPEIPIEKPEIRKPKKDPADLNIVADVLATIFKLTFGVAITAIGLTAWAVVSILGSGLLLDPTIIVVLEDGTWLECMTWYE